MHNKVVYRMARGLRQAGAVVLRFNYRGVNLSEGVYDNGDGETDDARVALGVLRERYPDLPFTIAGFSFGSRIALRLACEDPHPRRAILVGFPRAYQEAAPQCGVPRIFIQSTHDQFAPREEFERVYAGFAQPKRVVWIEAADHFFAGALEQVESAAAQAVSS